MQVLQIDGLDNYLRILRERPDEPQMLFNDLLIGVTRFFRDRREFDFLESRVVPRLFEGKGRSDVLRVWVLGCSTGEEAYSVAILLREHAARLDAPPRIQIFASDIDGRALAVARVGRFSAAIVADVTPERLSRWFVQEGETYVIAKELREVCIFSQHSIVKDPPFSRLDLISCRNLLIYLGADLQNRVVPLFHFALRPGGFLFLGNAENVSRHAQLFALVDRAYRIFQRLDSDIRVIPDFPAAPVLPGAAPVVPAPRTVVTDDDFTRRVARIAERYAPAYVIVDENFQVLHFSSKAGRFIHPSSGAPSLSLLDLVHGDLRLDLRRALMTAATQNHVAHVDNVLMGDNGSGVAIDLIVEPAAEAGQSRRAFVVLFRELSAPPDPERISLVAPDVHGDFVQRLQTELNITRERLQTMVEELQSTNEELRSSNEEYQSLNEELQSANEELQTSKEELQSVNEEVTTVNNELSHRVAELARANSDLKNLLESTQIATVFLDNELRVTNFTPAAAEIFHLVETDVGRPIGHIKPRVSYDDLQDDARRVIRTLGSADREVEDPSRQMRYIVRVLPYRSVDNFIGGAVVTFTDVTPLTRAQRALRMSEERLRLVTEHIPQLVWTAMNGGRWTWASPQWSEFTGQPEGRGYGLGWLDAVHPDDQPVAVEAWHMAESSGVLDAEWRIRAANGSYRWFHSRAKPLGRDSGSDLEWFGTSTDVHEMRELRERQGVLLSELQHRSRNLLGLVSSLAARTVKRGGSTQDFEERLAALSRAQGLLSRSANSAVGLDELVRTELAAHGDLTAPKTIVDGPDVRLSAKQVQTLALALHELTTNAVKYGALKDVAGRLSVTWRLVPCDESECLELDWVESEMNLEPDSVTRRGYGRELIERALTYSLRAKTNYVLDRDGVRCRIELPLA